MPIYLDLVFHHENHILKLKQKYQYCFFFFFCYKIGGEKLWLYLTNFTRNADFVPIGLFWRDYLNGLNR